MNARSGQSVSGRGGTIEGKTAPSDVRRNPPAAI